MGDVWGGLSGGRSLHDWLVDSSYLRNREAPPGPRKKRKSRGRGGTHGHERSSRVAGHPHQHLTQEELALGRRGLRRWLNEKLLRELAGPLDAAAIGGLFAPPPFGEAHETPLDIITQTETSEHIWEPFRSIDMDKQDLLLHGKKRQQGGSAGSRGCGPLHGQAAARWRAVERRLREALRMGADWPMLEQWEGEVLQFLEKTPHQDERGVADSAEGRSPELVIEVEDALARQVVHGLCQYYALVSTTGTGALGTPVVVVRHPRKQPAFAKDTGVHADLRLTQLLDRLFGTSAPAAA